MRLVNGANSSKGRVEICVGQEWGTVCDDRWDEVDAQVVCNQLGFSRFSKIFTFTLTYSNWLCLPIIHNISNLSDALAHGGASFGRGNGSIHLDEVRCTGTEARLRDCRFISRHDCSHFEDAGAVCSTIRKFSRRRRRDKDGGGGVIEVKGLWLEGWMGWRGKGGGIML